MSIESKGGFVGHKPSSLTNVPETLSAPPSGESRVEERESKLIGHFERTTSKVVRQEVVRTVSLTVHEKI